MADAQNTMSQTDLLSRYPELFSNITNSSEPIGSFGIQHRNGWISILYVLCFNICQHENNIRGRTNWMLTKDSNYECTYVQVRFTQIKQKYGGLCVYYDGGDEYVAGLVKMASSISYMICESCGSKGECNKCGYYQTLCDNCRANEKIDINPVTT